MGGVVKRQTVKLSGLALPSVGDRPKGRRYAMVLCTRQRRSPKRETLRDRTYGKPNLLSTVSHILYLCQALVKNIYIMLYLVT